MSWLADEESGEPQQLQSNDWTELVVLNTGEAAIDPDLTNPAPVQSDSLVVVAAAAVNTAALPAVTVATPATSNIGTISTPFATAAPAASTANPVPPPIRELRKRNAIYTCTACTNDVQFDRQKRPATSRNPPASVEAHVSDNHPNTTDWKQLSQKLGTLSYFSDGTREMSFEYGNLAGQQWVVIRRIGRPGIRGYWDPILRMS